MKNEQAIISCLNNNFININTEQALLKKANDGTMSTTTDATGVTWLHKHEKFSIILRYNDDIISYIGLGSSNEHKNYLINQNYISIQKMTFSKNPDHLTFEISGEVDATD